MIYKVEIIEQGKKNQVRFIKYDGAKEFFNIVSKNVIAPYQLNLYKLTLRGYKNILAEVGIK